MVFLVYKQVIIYNKDSKLNYNQVLKHIVNGSVLSVEQTKQNNSNLLKSWLNHGQKKVTLQALSYSDIQEIILKCQKKGILFIALSSEGVLINKQTLDQKICILVIGPNLEKKIDPITNHLKLY